MNEKDHRKVDLVGRVEIELLIVLAADDEWRVPSVSRFE